MKIARLESVRGFAAAYVVLVHTLIPHLHGLARLPVSFGTETVMVFFVLSGFVIELSKGDTRDPLFPRRFLLRRWCRIYPVFLLSLLAMWLLMSLQQGAWAVPDGAQLACNLLMLQDMASAKPGVICAPVFDDVPLWSLHYEWWFYMAFPFLVLRLAPPRQLRWVGGAALIASVVYCFWPNPLSPLFMYLTVWWVGVEAARVYRRGSGVRLADLRQPLFWVCAAAVGPLAACAVAAARGKALAFGYHPVLEARILLSSVAIVLFAFAWRRAGWIGFDWTVGPFRLLAPISFSLYAVHYVSIANATYLQGVGNRWIEVAGYIAVTVVFCIFAERVFYPWTRKRVLAAFARPAGAAATGGLRSGPPPSP